MVKCCICESVFSLEEEGWLEADDGDICPACVEEAQEGLDEQDAMAEEYYRLRETVHQFLDREIGFAALKAAVK